MSLAALFPSLERTMRETELFDQLHETGYLPHRVTLPMYMPRPWERPIGGPETPALDGLLSMVLKTYREHRRSTGRDWLEKAWPKVKLAMERALTFHDSDNDGVLKGEQPNTYDISIYGPNTFMGTLYLAALRAAEMMANEMGEKSLAKKYAARFKQGSAGYDKLLWDYGYYIQIYDAEKNPEQNYGKGCHSDQLFGQWWAHVLGLGHLLPQKHVGATVDSIIKYNLRENFVGHKQQPRQFVSDDEPGLLICSWPQGERPKVPTLYSDEIWTGIEYEVAALCMYEGRLGEGLEILRCVRKRYDGSRRSPWNDIECGDHYARALSSWALLDAICGYQYDGPSGSLTVSPRIDQKQFRAFFIAAEGWGSISISRTDSKLKASIDTTFGSVSLRTISLPFPSAKSVKVKLKGKSIGAKSTKTGALTTLRLDQDTIISGGEALTIEAT